MSYYVIWLLSGKAILKKEGQLFFLNARKRMHRLVQWCKETRPVDNGTSRKGTTGNSSDLCELRKEKEDDSR